MHDDNPTASPFGSFDAFDATVDHDLAAAAVRGIVRRERELIDSLAECAANALERAAAQNDPYFRVCAMRMIREAQILAAECNALVA